MTWDEKLKELVDAQAKYVEAQKASNEALEVYKKRCMDHLGFVDGQQMNIVQLATLVRKLCHD